MVFYNVNKIEIHSSMYIFRHVFLMVRPLIYIFLLDTLAERGWGGEDNPFSSMKVVS